MQNLLQLIARYGAFILFILLEILCLYLIVNFNRSQREIYLNSSGLFSAWITRQTDQVSRFWNLSEVADSLARDNARLRADLDKALYTPLSARDTIRDTSYRQEYHYVACRIINNSIHLWDNKFTLDCGSRDGVRKGMGVISDDGVVGVIQNVSEHFSQGVSILNGQVRISATHARSGQFGTMVWRGSDPRYISLRDVPKYAEIDRGDTIVTNRYSAIFPDGIPIGQIDTFWVERGTNFYNMEVRLNNDVSKLRYVYVVDYLFKEEQLEVEQKPANE